MTDTTSRSRALRACGVADPGLEPEFDRLAHLTVLATQAATCVVVFGDPPLVKGQAGAPDTATAASLEFHAHLLEESSPAFASRSEVAGAVIRDPTGLKVGTVRVVSAAPRTWAPEALGALTDVAHLAENELLVRARRSPDERAASITEGRVAELTRDRERDAILKTQAESLAHLGYWVWEVDRNRVTWSPELYRIYGLDHASFPASFEGYLGRLHPGDRDRVRQTIEDALRGRNSFTFEERIIRPNGELRHLRSWGSVNVNAEGHATEMFGTCLDVTEMVRVTEGLRRTQDWLRTALRNARVAVWEWNVTTNDVKFSDDAADVLGVRSEALGESFDAFVGHLHAEDRIPFMEVLRGCASGGADVDGEFRVAAPDDRIRWVVARGRCHKDASGRVDRLLGTMVDVTERHRFEEERRHLVEKLGHAQKMDAIGRLSAEIAHDVNNHLTIIQSSVEQVRHLGLDASAESGVRNVEAAVKSCAALTGQLLSFSRDQSRAPRNAPLDLGAVVEESCTVLRRLLPRNVQLELSLAPGLPRISSHKEQIDRVLLNLIVNARDAMPSGGKLTIVTRKEGDGVVLEVRDTGVGMTADVRARVFEPFFTTKEPGRGTGLGLSMVYGIVAQNGGAIDVESTPGQGSAFIVRLPLAG